MTTITLQEVVSWLSAKPAQEVVCWDTFEPRHGLMVSYYHEQGYEDVRSEYDKAMIDTRAQKTALAQYDRDLTHFNYALHYCALRYRPTAGELLEYYQGGMWQKQPQGIPQWMLPIEEYNLLHDRADRPTDLPWRHLEIITYQGQEYLVQSALFPANFGGSDRVHPEYGASRRVEISIDANRAEIPFVSYALKPSPPHYPGTSRGSCEYDSAYGGRYQLAVNLFDGDTLALTTYQHVLLGVWQRQGERLVLLS